MNNRNIVIPVKYNTYGYKSYQEFVRPYLDVFGMPYDEVQISDIPERLEHGAALVLLAQSDIKLSDCAAKAIKSALNEGCGLVCTSSIVLDNAEFYNFVDFDLMPNIRTGSEISVDREHYITRFHTVGERIPLYKALAFYTDAHLKNAETLICTSSNPLLEIAEYGKGKIALWNTVSWISTDILGPLHGMDDIFRDAVIWAAKKPFVMKGMPPFVGMRVDDVWGAWRDKTPDNPLLWMEIASKYGLKPWLGVFQDNINKSSVEIVKNYVKDGRATAFPHAYAGCEWVASDIAEDWLWFDHRHARPWDEKTMAKRAERAKAWFDQNGIPISKLALAHYYETSECAIPILLSWGCEFIGVHMPPDAAYLDGAKLCCGPYRKYSQLASDDSHPAYYADYLEFPHNPEIDKKMFNCVTEIRDVRGYEFAPTNDVESTIDSGVVQLRRAITSSVPAVLFTHESKWIQRITPENWEREIKSITEAISDLNPVYDTMDNICKYVRASHDIKIENVDVELNGDIKLSVTGKNDMDTKCVTFFEENSSICEKQHVIPKADGCLEFRI